MSSYGAFQDPPYRDEVAHLAPAPAGIEAAPVGRPAGGVFAVEIHPRPVLSLCGGQNDPFDVHDYRISLEGYVSQDEYARIMTDVNQMFVGPVRSTKYVEPAGSSAHAPLQLDDYCCRCGAPVAVL